MYVVGCTAYGQRGQRYTNGLSRLLKEKDAI